MTVDQIKEPPFREGDGMFKIGEFSRIAQVTVKALRFYDEIGLLKPARYDAASGYRYYSAVQLNRLNRIIALKELGFTLEEIHPMLSEDISVQQLRGMLRLKQSEIQQRMDSDIQKLARVQSRLERLERENTLSAYEVVIKSAPVQRIASIRQTLPSYQAVGALFGELFGWLQQSGQHPVGPCGALWHDEGYKETDVDGEAYSPVGPTVVGDERIKISELAAIDMAASLVLQGSYSKLNRAYESLLAWISQNGYRAAGPPREIYLKTGIPGDQNDETCVTEIQFPVTKAE